MADSMVRAIDNRRDLRFIVIDNTETVRQIAALHGISGSLLKPFGQIITASQLLGTQLKGAGAVTVLVESDGVVKRMTADANPFGLTRATVSPSTLENAATDDLSKPFIGNGSLIVQRALIDKGAPYTSIVDLVSPDLARCVAYYLHTSEQVRSAVGLATSFDHEGLRASGGFMIQAFPGETAEKTIAEVEDLIASLPHIDDIFNEYTDVEAVARQLGGGADLEILRHDKPEPYCPCTRASSERAVMGLGRVELEQLSEAGEVIALSCDYCRTRYEFGPEEIAELCKRFTAVSDSTGAINPEGAEGGEGVVGDASES